MSKVGLFFSNFGAPLWSQNVFFWSVSNGTSSARDRQVWFTPALPFYQVFLNFNGSYSDTVLAYSNRLIVPNRPIEISDEYVSTGSFLFWLKLSPCHGGGGGGATEISRLTALCHPPGSAYGIFCPLTQVGTKFVLVPSYVWTMSIPEGLLR